MTNLCKSKKEYTFSKFSKPKMRRYYYIEGYKFVLPAAIFMFFMTVFPSIYAIYISITNWTLGSPTIKVVWFKNYLDFFQQAAFKDIVFSTIIFGAGVILSVLVIGMIIALLLNQRLPLS